MEGARQFQDRGVRRTSGRVGWAYVGGLRRSGGRSQGVLDLPRFRIPGATRDSRRGSCPGRTRSDCVARRTEAQLIADTTTSHSPPGNGRRTFAQPPTVGDCDSRRGRLPTFPHDHPSETGDLMTPRIAVGLVTLALALPLPALAQAGDLRAQIGKMDQ